MQRRQDACVRTKVILQKTLFSAAGVTRDTTKTQRLEHAHLDVQLATIVLVGIIAITFVAAASPPLPFPRGFPPLVVFSGALTTPAAATCRGKIASVYQSHQGRKYTPNDREIRGGSFLDGRALLGAHLLTQFAWTLRAAPRGGCRGPVQIAELPTAARRTTLPCCSSCHALACCSTRTWPEYVDSEP